MTERRKSSVQPFSQQGLRELSEQIGRDYPPRLQQPALELVDVDPWHLHVYWNQPQHVLDAALTELAPAGEAHLVLRFRDIPDADINRVTQPVHAFDIPIQAAIGHLQVPAPTPGHCYEAELGATARDGGWRLVARSERVCMPAQGPLRPGANESVRLPLPAVAESNVDMHDLTGPARVWLSLDKSLEGETSAELPPQFPNTAPVVESMQPLSESNLASTAAPPPLWDASADNADDQQQAVYPVHASSSLTASELRVQLYVSGHAEPGKVMDLYGVRMMTDERGAFQLLRELDPQEDCIFKLLHPDRKD